jgi:DNA-binding cell septation regulator SpoVG
MKVTNIKIKQVIPDKGHIGFISCVVDSWLFLNNIAVFTRLSDPEKIRLVFPEKKVGDKKINLFYPLTSEAYFELEKAIQEKLKQL